MWVFVKIRVVISRIVWRRVLLRGGFKYLMVVGIVLNRCCKELIFVKIVILLF